MSSTHLHGHFYHCDECGETYDGKHNDHMCDSRDELLARVETQATALAAFVDTFEQPGRIDVCDLNAAYELACAALGREAKDL